MQIKALSERTNLPVQTIRYYESVGVLPPPRRLENGYRDYDEADVERGRFVAGARNLGLALDDIKEIMALRDRQDTPCRFVLNLLKEKEDEIDRRIADLQRMKVELEELYRLGQTFPVDAVDSKRCVCHLVSERAESEQGNRPSP